MFSRKLLKQNLAFMSTISKSGDILADGPAEDLYGIFINRVRRERGEELAFNIKGFVQFSLGSLIQCIKTFDPISCDMW